MPGSPAHSAGLLANDSILRIDDHDVSTLTSDTVARVIRHCSDHMTLRIRRDRVSGPKPPERGTSKTVLRDFVAKNGPMAGQNGPKLGQNGPPLSNMDKSGSNPWQPVHGSLESRSRTSEGESFGQSEVEGEEGDWDSYVDMQSHWAYVR